MKSIPQAPSLNPLPDAQTAAAWVDAIEAKRQELIGHTPLRLARARDIPAIYQRARALSALTEARYQRYSDLNVCLRCYSAERGPDGVYCEACAAVVDEMVRKVTGGI